MLDMFTFELIQTETDSGKKHDTCTFTLGNYVYCLAII